MSQIVCPGEFDASAKFVPADAAQFAEARRKFVGQRVELVLRKPQSKRSLDMNAYLHKWPFPMLAEHFGDSIEGTKLDLMGEFFGWVPGPVSGKLVPIKAHTSDMTKEESSAFLDWLIPWAATTHGVEIPYPRECM